MDCLSRSELDHFIIHANEQRKLCLLLSCGIKANIFTDTKELLTFVWVGADWKE